MKNDLISVIVPCYNVEKYLKKCVDSITNQTYKNTEIILVDDGSTDKTPEICDKLAQSDSRIKVIHKSNGGVTKARFTGIKSAMGKWIGFVDSDDCIEPYMYEKLLSNAIKYNADISHCGMQMQFGDGRIKYFYNTGRVIEQNKDSALISLLKGDFIEPGLCNKLYKRELFNSIIENKKMDTSIKNNEDLLMNFMLFSNALSTIYEDFCPYIYQIREQSASRGNLNFNKIYDPIKVRKKILEFSEKHIKGYALRSYISTCISQYNALILKKEYKSESAEIRSLICNEKIHFNLLSRKRRVIAILICHVHKIYDLIYFMYSKFLQKKKYF